MGMIVAAIAIVGLIIVFHDIGQGVETPRLFSHLTAYARVNMIFIGLMGLAYLYGWWSLRGLRSEERRVGKDVSVRVDLGGRRFIKKKTKKHTNYITNKET